MAFDLAVPTARGGIKGEGLFDLAAGPQPRGVLGCGDELGAGQVEVALAGAFGRALPEGTTGGVAIVKKHGEPWIRVSPRGKQEEPESLVAVKSEIERRWGTIDLLDILKYAEFDTDFIAEFTSVATREMLSKDVLRRRLLLVLFGLRGHLDD